MSESIEVPPEVAAGVDTDDDRKEYDQFLQMEGQLREPGGVDEETGWRYEYWHIAMTRNARAENRRRLRVYLDPAPHVVLDQNVPLRGWYKAKVERPGARPRPCYTEALLTQPYGGSCPVRCVFCYVNNGLRGYRGQGVTTVDPDYPLKVLRQIKRMRTGSAFYISSFTEPFQPGIEAHYHNTQRTAAVAVGAGLPVFFLTRQTPPGWAVDVVRKNPFSYFQFSINTPRRDHWRRLSPRAAPLDDQVEAIRELSRKGVYISVQVNPIMSGVTTVEEVVTLIHELAQAGAHHLIFKHIEIVSPAAKQMVKKMHRLFPDRGADFEALFSETIGSLRTIKEGYRKSALDRYLIETRAAGVTMGLCYEYEYGRDESGKVVDRAGVSLGPKYTTGDQCHGRKVPMFSRPTVYQPFVRITVCDPGGCLYCADHHGGVDQVPCGTALLGEATALKPRDYREPAWAKHRLPIR